MFKIYDGRYDFWQWDIDRKIVIADKTIDKVHFCNKTSDCSLVVEVYEENGLRLANVPNILLQDNKTIWVYGYCGGCYTKNSASFNVKKRTKPADYIYTETEVETFKKLESRIKKLYVHNLTINCFPKSESIPYAQIQVLFLSSSKEKCTLDNYNAMPKYCEKFQLIDNSNNRTEHFLNEMLVDGITQMIWIAGVFIGDATTHSFQFIDTPTEL